MSIGEEQIECPLCMEPLELDDLNFFPCTCGYQICRFCWHRIRTDENGLCPACRKAYPEDPAEFKPLTEDEFSCHRLQRIKRERKVKDLQRKQKAAENRKHLANVRVVQKNLVFVVGLSQRLGDTEVLKKHDYFGKFGKIVKVVINQSTSYAGSSGPSASAYITYQKPEDALRAIQAVNNIHVDGRTLKASLGTTKYCSHFLRGTQCPKGDCMYLHELGDGAASFTKDEMQQGKHQEYEQKLYETYMNHLNSVNLATNQTTTTSTSQTATKQTTSTSRKKSSSPAPTQRQTPPLSGSQNSPHNTADAWPSLNTGPGGRQTTDRQTGHTRTGSQDLHRHTPDSQRPSPQLDTCSTSSSSSSSHSNSSSQPSSRSPPQISPPGPSSSPHTQQQNGTQIPPVTTTESQTLHRHTHNNIHTQGPTVSRKPLYGDTSDNMSLFSSSGFPVTRNPSKPPMVSLLATTQSQAPNPTSITNTDTTTDTAPSSTPTPATANSSSSGQQPPQQQQPVASDGSSDTQQTADSTTHHHPAIPDTISVTSATDWQAAFGFQPSALATQQHQQQSQLLGLMNNAAVSGMLGQSHNSEGSSSSSQLLADVADDDLGFDPWNESTKALQDLIESESVNKHQHHHQQSTVHQPQSMNHIPQQNSVQNMNHLNSIQQQSLLDRTKPLPPGFTPNHITSAFNHNPLLGGSRMMNLMKIPPQQQQNPSQYDIAELTNQQQQQAHQQQQQQQHQQSLHNSDPFNMKSWQEGLRALFPANVNIHFGLPSSGAGGLNQLQQQQQQLASQQQQQMGGLMGQMQQQQQQNIPSLQSLQMNSRQQNSIQTPQHTHNTQYSWDFDPAILTVSGNMTGETNNLLEEPHWMASLHHLTEEPTNQSVSNSKFLPNSTAHHLASHHHHHHNSLTTHHGSSATTLGLKQLHQNAAFAAAPAAAQGAPAPPPGFQNTLRPPPQMATTGLEAHKLIDGFQ